jgi:hypothetical protein
MNMDIGREYKLIGYVPSCTVQEQKNRFIGVPHRHFFKKERHGFRIYLREDERIYYPITGTDCGKDMGVFTNKLISHCRANPGWGPTSLRIVDSAEPPFILEHHPYRSDLRYEFREVFLKTACAT